MSCYIVARHNLIDIKQKLKIGGIIMMCPKCGTELSENMKFCPECGEPISKKSKKTASPSSYSWNGDKIKCKHSNGSHSPSIDEPQRKISPQNTHGENKFPTISLICGIIGILTFWLIIGVPIAIVGIVFGIISLVRKYPKRWMAALGLSLSSVSILIFTVIVAIVVAFGDFTPTDVVDEKAKTEESESPEKNTAKEDKAAIEKKKQVKKAERKEADGQSEEAKKDADEAKNRDEDEGKAQENPLPSVLSDDEYKAQCAELWYDNIFFSEDNLEGQLVKLNLFVEESRYFNADSMYNVTASDFIKKWDLQRDFYYCGVQREGENSYVGRQISMYFTNTCGYSAGNMAVGDHIVIYGEIIDYSTMSWDGYNSCGIIPRIIENNGQ